MREAMVAFGLDPDHIGAAARARHELLGYVELHIEQGPVLEQRGLPVGVVTAIAGATRLAAKLTGMAGHAGTVPMALRRDALAGAAECIAGIEEYCRTDESGLVGTVGLIDAKPGATNMIREMSPSPSTSARPPTCTARARSPTSCGTSRRSQSGANWRCSSTSPMKTAPCPARPG
jgi:allantoate deiminase